MSWPVSAPTGHASELNRNAGVLLAMCAILAMASTWALTIGAAPISLSTVMKAIVSFDGSHDHLVVTTVRLPRVLTGIVVGASFATAGAIMQAVTGNPLASPGILGINSGAAFAVVLALISLDLPSRENYVWFAFTGAAMAAAIVYLAASVGGNLTPIKLALSGAIFSTFLGSVTAAILIFDGNTLSAIRLWTAGSLSAAELSSVLSLSPYSALGLFLAFVLAGQLITMSLGAEIARSVGQSLTLWRAVAGLCVVLLAGSSVALAGPIGFVGLVVPHMVRLLIGHDYRWVIPYCGVGGAILVVVADAVLKTTFPNNDVPVGVTMAVIGAPFFIYLARRHMGAS